MKQPFEPCEDARWELGDGRIMSVYDISALPITYAESGTYTIRLTSSIGNGQCSSIKEKTVTVHGYNDPHTSDNTAYFCKGTNYNFLGTKLTAPGKYTKTLKTSYGCDSIINLNLYEWPTYIKDTFAMKCPGTQIRIHNMIISDPGVYTDTLHTVFGCDSIIKWHVDEYQSYVIEQNARICQGESFQFNNQDLRRAGDYYDTLKTIHGCDSIIHLTLEVNPNYYFEEIATVCSNEPYDFHGRILYNSGVYYDSLMTHLGCDSIYKLTLTVLPAYLITDYLEICEDDRLTYRGKDILEPGIYYDSLQTETGCDSVYKIVVNKAPTYLYESHAQMSQGGSYNFRGRSLTEVGVYYDSLLTVSGCDSIFKLTLHENPIYYYEDSIALCQSELPYDFHGRLLYKSGTYYDSLSTQIGADSIYRLILSVHPVYEKYDIVDLCEGDSVWFGGKFLYDQGMYSDTLKTRMGCDSIFHLTVNRARSYYSRDSIALPVGETYIFHGQTIRVSGTYFDYQKTYQGCDSIYEQIVMFYPSYHFRDRDTICSSATPYVYHGRSYYETGVYYDSLRTVEGFDSIYQLTLTVLQDYMYTKTFEICEGTEFMYHNLVINKRGIYYDTLITSDGCDSICRIIVNFAPKYLFTIRDSMAEASSYIFRGRTITVPGIYYDSLQTTQGCDSVYRLILTKTNDRFVYTNETICQCRTPYVFFGQNIYQSGTYYYFQNDTTYQLDLTVNPDYEIINYLEICEGSVLTYRGHTILEQGIYYDSLYTKHGCDSIYKIIVNRAASYVVDIDKSICKGSYYSFGGQKLTEQGVYYDTLQARTTSCDSIIRLILTVGEPDTLVTYDTICAFDTYIFNGQPITKSGTYYIHSYNAAGCDSTNLLYLTVLPQQITYDTVQICKGETYYFGGRVLTEVGDYIDTICNPHGNKSTITYLHLTAAEPTTLGHIESPDVCADSKSFTLDLIYESGVRPDQYSISFDQAAKNLGFVDLHNQPLNEDFITIQLPEQPNSHTYLYPDIYTLRLELRNNLCSDLTQEYTIPFMIRYPSYILEQNWDDVVAILNESYNGGYTFTRYEWYVNGHKVNNAVNSYLYLSSLQTGDEVYANLTRSTDGVTIPTCIIVIDDISSEQLYEYPVLVFPNAIKRGQSIRILANPPARYKVYDMMGKGITSGTIESFDEQEVTINTIGTYLIQVVTDEIIHTEKVVVE